VPRNEQVGRHHAARRQPEDHFQVGYLAQHAPRPQRAEEPRSHDGRVAEESEWGPEGRNGPPSVFRSPASLTAAEACAGWAEDGAFRPPGHSAWTAEYRFSYAVGAHTTEEGRDEPDGVLDSRRTRESRLPAAVCPGRDDGGHAGTPGRQFPSGNTSYLLRSVEATGELPLRIRWRSWASPSARRARPGSIPCAGAGS
jgi:hypothetical protein